MPNPGDLAVSEPINIPGCDPTAPGPCGADGSVPPNSPPMFFRTKRFYTKHPEPTDDDSSDNYGKCEHGIPLDLCAYCFEAQLDDIIAAHFGLHANISTGSQPNDRKRERTDSDDGYQEFKCDA